MSKLKASWILSWYRRKEKESMAYFLFCFTVLTRVKLWSQSEGRKIIRSLLLTESEVPVTTIIHVKDKISIKSAIYDSVLVLEMINCDYIFLFLFTVFPRFLTVTNFQFWSLIEFKESHILKIKTEIVSITVLVYLWNIC